MISLSSRLPRKSTEQRLTRVQSNVKCLGHVISAHGVTTDPAKIEAVRSWAVPSNTKELKSFPGFTGLLQTVYQRILVNSEAFEWFDCRLWSTQEAERKDKEEKWPDQEEPNRALWISVDPWMPTSFRHVDWEAHHVPGPRVCGQQQTVRVAHWCVRHRTRCSFLPRRRRWEAAYKWELLALKWAITEKFRDYLYGTQFTVVTDTNPLTYLITTAKLNATGHRWLAALSNFDFTIKYRPGRSNIDADRLSRKRHPLRFRMMNLRT